MRHVALVGTTASGKSALALAIARAHRDIELVSIDSMQVYRGMDIGTAKPTLAERAEVPHHLVDLAEPDEEFTVARFPKRVRRHPRRHRSPWASGAARRRHRLYLRAVIDGFAIPGRYPEAARELEGATTAALHERLTALDPVAATRMEAGNRRRIVRALEVTLGSGRPFSSYGPGLTAYPDTPFRLVGVALPAAVVSARIEERYRAQLDAGFLDEVRALAARPQGLSRTAAQALGYRELLAHVRGEVTLDDAVDEAVRRTRRFARRQRSWFRRDPRIEWLESSSDPVDVLPSLERVVSGQT